MDGGQRLPDRVQGERRSPSDLQEDTSSLLSLQSRYIADKQALEAFKDSRNRIRSMALVHEKLHISTNPSKVNFGGYIRDLARQLGGRMEVSTGSGTRFRLTFKA